MNHLRPFLLFIMLGSLLFITGCGGGGSGGSAQNASNTADSATRGSLAFNILWPTPSRVIPAAAQSLVITLTDAGSGTQLAKKIIPRPPAGTNTSSVRFDALPPKIISITVAAFPNPDGTGTEQAVGSATVAIIAGLTTQASIDPSSTVDHIVLSPDPLVLIPSSTKILTASTQNVQNAIVLVAPSSLNWTTSNAAVATVDTSGNVRGVSLGIAEIRVVDSESGKTSSVSVHVVPPIVINPPDSTVTLGDTIDFTAMVTGLDNSLVIWSIQEGTDGGSIDRQSGHYIAPNHSGTFHIIATSVSNPTISATATVTVKSGSGTIIIK